jgi:hypothetical protein
MESCITLVMSFYLFVIYFLEHGGLKHRILHYSGYLVIFILKTWRSGNINKLFIKSITNILSKML